MWLLIVSVIYIVGGEVREQQFSAPPVATQAECMAHGREAVERMTRIDGVTAIAFACRQLPQT